MSDNKHEFDRKWTATEKTIDDPLRWRKASRVRLSSDLFYESVRVEWIDRIFAVMALSRQHTFQVLTKRPERMRDYLAGNFSHITDKIMQLRKTQRAKLKGLGPNGLGPMPHMEAGSLGHRLTNVWLGVSIEDQATADERIPLLLDMPAAKLADLTMLATEKRDLMAPSNHAWLPLPRPRDRHVWPLEWRTAERHFLVKAAELLAGGR